MGSETTCLGMKICRSSYSCLERSQLPVTRKRYCKQTNVAGPNFWDGTFRPSDERLFLICGLRTILGGLLQVRLVGRRRWSSVDMPSAMTSV